MLPGNTLLHCAVLAQVDIRFAFGLLCDPPQDHFMMDLDHDGVGSVPTCRISTLSLPSSSVPPPVSSLSSWRVESGTGTSAIPHLSQKTTPSRFWCPQ